MSGAFRHMFEQEEERVRKQQQPLDTGAGTAKLDSQVDRILDALGKQPALYFELLYHLVHKHIKVKWIAGPWEADGDGHTVRRSVIPNKHVGLPLFRVETTRSRTTDGDTVWMCQCFLNRQAIYLEDGDDWPKGLLGADLGEAKDNADGHLRNQHVVLLDDIPDGWDRTLEEQP